MKNDVRQDIILSPADCERLANNQRIVKGLVRDSKFANLRAGDTIEIAACQFKVRIVGIRYYPNFKKLLFNEGLHWVVPEISSLVEAIKALQGKISDEQIVTRGVLALELEKSIIA